MHSLTCDQVNKMLDLMADWGFKNVRVLPANLCKDKQALNLLVEERLDATVGYTEKLLEKLEKLLGITVELHLDANIYSEHHLSSAEKLAEVKQAAIPLQTEGELRLIELQKMYPEAQYLQLNLLEATLKLLKAEQLQFFKPPVKANIMQERPSNFNQAILAINALNSAEIKLLFGIEQDLNNMPKPDAMSINIKTQQVKMLVYNAGLYRPIKNAAIDIVKVQYAQQAIENLTTCQQERLYTKLRAYYPQMNLPTLTW